MNSRRLTWFPIVLAVIVIFMGVGHRGSATAIGKDLRPYSQYAWPFASEMSRDLAIISLAENLRIELVGQVAVTADQVAVAGNYAFVADSYTNDGLHVINISNPYSPAVIGSADIPARTFGIDIQGNYAYFATQFDGLHIYNVAKPATPTLVGVHDTTGWPADVIVMGRYAYVAADTTGLRIIDIADPTAPGEVGFYDTPGFAIGLAIAGSYAYIADGYNGLRIINISNPKKPTEVGFIDTPGVAVDVALAGSYAYVADSSGGLRVISVVNPSSPIEVGSYVATGQIDAVAVGGNLAYAIDSQQLKVINVGNPTNPILVDSYETTNPIDVTLAGDYIYVTDFEGLLILQLTQAEPDLGFRPNPNGYQFRNKQLYRTPSMFEQFYGKENTQCANAEAYFSKHYSAVAKGWSCYGFSVTSLLSYLNWPQPNSGSFAMPHFAQLYNQPDQAQLAASIAYYSGTQLSRAHHDKIHAWIASCENNPSEMVERIRQGIQSREPVIVGLIAGSLGSHALVPYRMEEVSTDQTDVYVYDSEAPGQERVIHFKPANNWWQYSFVGSLSGAGTRTGSCKDMYFFSLATSLQQGIPLENFCQEPGLAAREAELADASGRVLVRVPAEGDWVIRDVEGRYLGWQEGQFVSQIPSAYPIFQALGIEPLSHRELYLPVASYTLQAPADPPQAFDYAFFGDGRMIGAEGDLRLTTSSYEMSVSPDLEQTTIAGLQNLETLNLTFIHEQPDSSRVAAIFGDLISGEAVLTGHFDGDQLVISRANGSLRYQLSLGHHGNQPGEFISAAVELGPTEEHILKPINWDGLGSSAIILEIDRGSDGTIDETRTLTNLAERQYLPSVIWK